MTNEDNDKRDIIDEDLYEDIDDEKMYELVQEERRKALEEARRKKENQKPKRPFPKWVFYLIASMMAINVIAVLPNTFSIPAVDFLVTSAKLSADKEIKQYKKAVVVVEAGQSNGTGFSIDSNGTILTNHHVIEGEKQISVGFPDDGLFKAEVVETYPSIDLAVLKIEGEALPFLELADETSFQAEEEFLFIGNPLRFTGIANQGEILKYTDLDSWEDPVLMLDAPIYRGNSGSPVINSEGKVIGVVFATLHDDEEGRVGLAVPIEYFHQSS
ncbi:S1C family serine protease [Halobacillus sp. Marseille-Q1614]|uniref:S1C family serine protease n=1 Tax=Halobacillus sp. Marseille-Q1614 TaxID=2709134 RepID=UPI0020C26490|nr:serine protease [Halobacillus sp. Marseille-Q1614]